MSEKEKFTWTDEENKILRGEAFVAELLSFRNEKAGEKPRWQRFLESTGGAALITVLLGGIFGSCITDSLQKGAKDREFQQAWLKSRGDQALVAHKEFLEKQQETIKKVYERIGTTMSAADDLIALSHKDLTPSNELGDEERKKINEQNEQIRKRYNLIDREWRTERDTLAILLNYFFPKKAGTSLTQSKFISINNQVSSLADSANLPPSGDPDVSRVWEGVKNSVNSYMRCSEKWIAQNADLENTQNACAQEKAGVAKNLEALTKSFEANRKYSWEGWENPEKLKIILEKTSRYQK